VCESACPDVFEVQDDKCIIRPEALSAHYLASRTQDISTATTECPVGVIRFETTNVAPVPTGADQDPGEVSRRSVLTATGVGWIALGSSAALGTFAAGRFMFPNAVAEPDPTIRAGQLSTYTDLPDGSVVSTFSDQGAWIVRLKDRIVALGTTCTHLGCPTHWDGEHRRFKCPCHGSNFTIDGTNIDGPAPRALDRYRVTEENGELIVDRNKAFRKEKKQWESKESFIRT